MTHMHIGAEGFTSTRVTFSLRRRANFSRCRALKPEDFQKFILDKQAAIIQGAERLDGGQTPFKIDKWERDPSNSGAGYGITAILEGGQLLEKAAVNVSIIKGTLSAERAQSMSSRGRDIDQAGGQEYSAAALSLVFHPTHPYVPTLRADVRCFRVGKDCWFGGGCDLTPAYFFEEDARSFHTFWQGVCEKHRPGSYNEYKAWCDRYFYLPARKEHRGLGGVFFDDLTEDEAGSAEQLVYAIAEGILPSWEGIATRRRCIDYSEHQRQWQLLRRGRYLEFNLLYDRGVKFGLNGRIESVMVSAPPLIAWKYNVQPDAGSPEEELVQILQKPQDWA